MKAPADLDWTPPRGTRYTRADGNLEASLQVPNAGRRRTPARATVDAVASSHRRPSGRGADLTSTRSHRSSHLMASVFALALIVAGPLASSVSAGTDTSTATLVISPHRAAPTAIVSAAGTGFSSGETVSIDMDGAPVQTTRAGASGAFQAHVRIPSTAIPGRHTVGATGETSGSVATDSVIVTTTWADGMFGPLRDGWNRTENVVNATNVAGLSPRWTAPLGAFTAFASPIVAGGMVFVGDDASTFHAFAAATGHEVWSVKAEGFFLGSAAYGDGMVFASSVYGPLHAYDARTGRLRWTVACSGGLRASPVAVPHVVVASCFDGTVEALDARTGATRWTASVGCCIYDQAPALSDGVVYQMSTDDTLTAIDAFTGAQIWSVPAFSVGGVAVSNGRVFYSDYPNVVAVDATDGSTLWQARVLSFQPDGTPAVANGIVYAQSGDIVALRAATGATLWTGSTNSYKAPIVAGGVVYASPLTMNYVADWDTFDATTGAHLSTVQTSAGTCKLGPCTETTPVIADGTLYLAGPGPQLVALGLP
jgi:outer membrane protein assembly factor BamB